MTLNQVYADTVAKYRPRNVYYFACGEATDQTIFNELGVNVIGFDVNADDINIATKSVGRKFTVVVCLSIHTFFESRKHLMVFWEHMRAAVLKKGVVIIKCLDGDHVRAIFPNTFFDTDPREYGDEMTHYAHPVVTKYKYLVYTDKLLEVARVYGFTIQKKEVSSFKDSNGCEELIITFKRTGR
jgi:hypothetical protein